MMMECLQKMHVLWMFCSFDGGDAPGALLSRLVDYSTKLSRTKIFSTKAASGTKNYSTKASSGTQKNYSTKAASGTKNYSTKAASGTKNYSTKAASGTKKLLHKSRLWHKKLLHKTLPHKAIVVSKMSSCDILLVITFHYPLYTSTDVLKQLYQDAFPNIVFCGPKPSEDEENIVVAMENGYFAYECLGQAIRKYPSYNGYLYANDDMIINWWNLVHLDRNKVWQGEEIIRGLRILNSKKERQNELIV
ncbi:hypothetical protein QZH41_005863 [Actinostola sp. cb2023]|nr:hypothetical protein QZH41_005863 [Actinostola sp. cb2023]